MIFLSVFLVVIFFPYLFALVLAGALLALIGTTTGSFSLYTYGFRIALSADQAFNVLLLGFPDESISGRVGRAIATGKPKKGVDAFGQALDWFFLHAFGDENHVETSVEPEDNFGARYEEFKLYRD